VNDIWTVNKNWWLGLNPVPTKTVKLKQNNLIDVNSRGMLTVRTEYDPVISKKLTAIGALFNGKVWILGSVFKQLLLDTFPDFTVSPKARKLVPSYNIFSEKKHVYLFLPTDCDSVKSLKELCVFDKTVNGWKILIEHSASLIGLFPKKYWEPNLLSYVESEDLF
jgi:hypothetical protein